MKEEELSEFGVHTVYFGNLETVLFPATHLCLRSLTKSINESKSE